MNRKIRVLHLVPGLDAGGIEMMLLNYYKNIDRNKIHFDFGMFFDDVGMTGKEFIKMGSNVFRLTPKSKGIKNYIAELTDILRNNEYDIVHAHQNYMSFFPLYYAKKCGVNIRIAHSHSTSVDSSNLLNSYFRIAGIYLNNLTATHKMSCGIEAGKYIFGKKSHDNGNVIVLQNAIDTEKFSFSNIKRKQIREKLNIEDKYVIGNIGRLSKEKNQTFLLEVFKVIQTRLTNSCLIIVGDGPLEGELKQRAKELGINENVHFLGRREDVNELMSAFDVFVLPSLHEGFPVVCVEAQNSGVKCIFSDKVPSEVSVTNLTEFVSLEKPFEYWASTIIKDINFLNRQDQSEIIKKSGYDIKEKAKWLENFYINCFE